MTHSKYVDFIIESKNFNSRNGIIVDCLVIHCTEASYEETIKIFLNEDVSAHYVVNIDGKITSMVEEENRAWHAGVSEWRGVSSLNSSSIGIEVVGYSDKTYPDVQIASVKKLCLDIMERYGIPKRNIVAHSDIGTVNERGLRKTDPGRFFPWNELSEYGVGNKLSPSVDRVKDPTLILYKLNDSNEDILKLKNQLHDYGYQIKDGYMTNLYDSYFSNVVHQFKLHFVPEQSYSCSLMPDRNWDVLSRSRLEYLMDIL